MKLFFFLIPGSPNLSTLIINNSGSENSGNEISNGSDDVEGNLVNGNGNDENHNAGNIISGSSIFVTFRDLSLFVISIDFTISFLTF